MAKKPRLGSFPLTREQEQVDRVVEKFTTGPGDSKHSKQSLQSKQQLQGKQVKKKAGRPKTSTREITSTSQVGTKAGWTRATFIVQEAHLDKLKDLAYWERKEIKEVVDEAISRYLKGKKIKPKERDK